MIYVPWKIAHEQIRKNVGKGFNRAFHGSQPGLDLLQLDGQGRFRLPQKIDILQQGEGGSWELKLERLSWDLSWACKSCSRARFASQLPKSPILGSQVGAQVWPKLATVKRPNVIVRSEIKAFMPHQSNMLIIVRLLSIGCRSSISDMELSSDARVIEANA